MIRHGGPPPRFGAGSWTNVGHPTQSLPSLGSVLTVYAEHHVDHILLRPRGAIDLLTVHLLDDALRKALDEAHASIVLDLVESTYLGCCAVRPLATARWALKATGRHLVLARAGGFVRRLLLHSELHDLLTDDQEADLHLRGGQERAHTGGR